MIKYVFNIYFLCPYKQILKIKNLKNWKEIKKKKKGTISEFDLLIYFKIFCYY